MSLAGARGAITLAGVLTLPLTLADGSPFPARDLAILLAMGVIIVSLVGANVGLPLLLKGLELPSEHNEEEENRARIAAAEAAIAEVGRVQHTLATGRPDADIYVAAASRIMDHYRARIEAHSQNGEAAQATRRLENIERTLLLSAVRAERSAIFAMTRRRKLGSHSARKLIRELDLLEARYQP